MDMRLDSSGGHPQKRCNLRLRKVTDVTQHDDLSLSARQRPKVRNEEVALLYKIRDVNPVW
jgi:hypothetical protein